MDFHWTNLLSALIAYLATALFFVLIFRPSGRSISNLLLTVVMVTIASSEIHVFLTQTGVYSRHFL